MFSFYDFIIAELESKQTAWQDTGGSRDELPLTAWALREAGGFLKIILECTVSRQ